MKIEKTYNKGNYGIALKYSIREDKYLLTVSTFNGEGGATVWIAFDKKQSEELKKKLNALE